MDNVRYQDDDGKGKRREFGKRKDGKKDKKDRGYMMFEEDSQEESLVAPDEKDKPHVKLKKHSKPSFKFVKKEKSYKPKEKEKEEKKKDEKRKEEKVKFKKKRIPSESKIATADENPIFGVPLPLAVTRSKSNDSIQLPAMFRECIDYIEEFGLMCEGIYRISGVKSKVQSLKDAYNKGLPVYLQEYEPNVVASLLKQFLRELPEPVLTAELMPKFEQASTVKSVKQRVGEFQRLVELLPTPNRLLLSWVIIHMTHVIAKEKQNKMSVQNISIVLSPTMQISHRVLNILFTYSKILFRDTVIKKYVPPLKPVTSHWSLDLPESPSSLEEELRKQEMLLEELHQVVMRVKDTEKEERLWEVQRVVTGLKRKLKLINKAQNQSPSVTRSVVVDRSKEAVSKRQTKAEPPQKLNLKVGDGDLDLRSAAALPSPTKQPIKSRSESTTSKSFTKKVALRPVGTTPTKDSSMDIGDIEMDSSAQSQKQRRDSEEILRKHRSEKQDSIGHIPEASELRQSRDTTSHKADQSLKSTKQNVNKSDIVRNESSATHVKDQAKSPELQQDASKVTDKTESSAKTIQSDSTQIKEKQKSVDETSADSKKGVIPDSVVQTDASDVSAQVTSNTSSPVSENVSCSSATNIETVENTDTKLAEKSKDVEESFTDLQEKTEISAKVEVEDCTKTEVLNESKTGSVPLDSTTDGNKTKDVDKTVNNTESAVDSSSKSLGCVSVNSSVKPPEGVTVDANRKPLGGVSVDTTAKPPDVTKLDSSAKPLGGVSVDTTAKPPGGVAIVDSSAKPVGGVSVDTTAKLPDVTIVDSSTKPPGGVAIVDSSAKPPGGVAVDCSGRPSGGVLADELAAALHELEEIETEEDLNQRIMSQFVADFGIERPAECDAVYEQLLDEYTALKLEEEELTIIGNEIKAKIESERYEGERLHEEITEVQAMREDLYSSDEKTDSDDSDYDDDDETMMATLDKLMQDNAQLQVENKDLCNKIYQEVQDCLTTKVQIRIIQQKQLESSKCNELDLLL